VYKSYVRTEKLYAPDDILEGEIIQEDHVPKRLGVGQSKRISEGTLVRKDKKTQEECKSLKNQMLKTPLKSHHKTRHCFKGDGKE